MMPALSWRLMMRPRLVMLVLLPVTHVTRAVAQWRAQRQRVLVLCVTHVARAVMQ